MSRYGFLSLWTVEASPEHVWDVIVDAGGYADWIRHVTYARVLKDGDAHGIGAISESTWKSPMGYGFTFAAETTKVQRPFLIELTAQGELSGSGIWRLNHEGNSTTVTYHWQVTTDVAWMKMVGPLLSPIFAWNHDVIMRAAGDGLARKLGVRITRNEAYVQEGQGLLVRLVRVAAMIALIWAPLRRLSRCFNSPNDR
jgi:uncharacterized protein YndB with AHSA1/START domain